MYIKTMLLKKLRCYIAVVDNGSFSKAAADLDMSQAAMSQQIKSLEDEVGAQLLVRHNRTFSITPAGTYFYKQVKSFIQKFDQICKRTYELDAENDNTLHIGYPYDYEGSELRKAILEFYETYPDANITLFTGNHEYLYEKLRKDEADMILNDQRRAFSSEYINLVLSDRFYFVSIVCTHPLAQKESIEMNELAFTDLIVISSDDEKVHESSHFKETLGIESPIVYAGNLEIARLMVESGKGYMLTSSCTNSENIASVPLTRNGERVPYTLCAFWKKSRSGYYTGEIAKIIRSQFIS